MIRTPYLNWYGKGFKLRAMITVACQMAFVLFGYDQGVFSGIVGNADFLNTFDHPSPALEGIIVSIYNLGCFSGCILTFMYAETTGRKLAMWIAMVWIIVGNSKHTSSHMIDTHRLVPSSKRPPFLYRTSWSPASSPASEQASRPRPSPCTNPSSAKPTNAVASSPPSRSSSASA